MTGELDFIRALRAVATDPAARGLDDDAAVLQIGGESLVLTMDTIVEGVHFLSDDPPGDVAWKLVAVNVSDLAAKGAKPLGCLYSHALGDAQWDAAFLQGLDAACRHFALPLLGGDTVKMPPNSVRSFSLTALGTGVAGCGIPDRRRARAGDMLWVSGTIGDAGIGLSLAQDRQPPLSPEAELLVERYRRPDPSPALGLALTPFVRAMMDVSDGLLVDALRLATASGVAMQIDLSAVPLSDALLALRTDAVATRLEAASAGDDYELLFTASPQAEASICEAGHRHGRKVAIIGQVSAGDGISLVHQGQPVPLPVRLGYQH